LSIKPKIIFTGNYYNKEVIDLDIIGLSNGFYMLYIENDDSKSVFKIVKE
tara:strand:+ start:548 stop:697 length:150 start_codon:yes stop_codon:yes gene_type:complete